MIDYIIIAVVIAVLGAAVRYIVKAKKSGKKCIGCPNGNCGCESKSSRCGCGCCGEEK